MIPSDIFTFSVVEENTEPLFPTFITCKPSIKAGTSTILSFPKYSNIVISLESLISIDQSQDLVLKLPQYIYL